MTGGRIGEHVTVTVTDARGDVFHGVIVEPPTPRGEGEFPKAWIQFDHISGLTPWPIEDDSGAVLKGEVR